MADSADDADAHFNNGATAPTPSRVIDRYRRNLEVVMPGMAIVFGCIILAITVIGLVLGHGVAAAEPQSSLVLSTSSVKDGDTCSATAKGFLTGEIVKFSWDGGPMVDAPPAGSGGSTTLPNHGGGPSGSGSREDFHLPAPTDPYVNLSIHTALVILVIRRAGLKRPTSNVRTS